MFSVNLQLMNPNRIVWAESQVFLIYFDGSVGVQSNLNRNSAAWMMPGVSVELSTVIYVGHVVAVGTPFLS